MTGHDTREYVVLLHGDEAVWREADEATRLEAFATHGEFTRLCGERGHTITGGAELAESRTSHVVRRGKDGAAQLTEGPFTETVEQLGGYYVIETADVEDLAQLVAMLIDDDSGVVEIRPAVPASEQPSPEEVATVAPTTTEPSPTGTGATS
jgi:hypothetical protein